MAKIWKVASVLLILALAAAGGYYLIRSLTGPAEGSQAVKEAAPFPEEALSVEESGGAVLEVDALALSEEGEITLTPNGEGIPFSPGSPFTPASGEYKVDLGGADQVGHVRLSIPLYGTGKEASAPPAFVYAAWTEPENGLPSMVGVAVEGEKAVFPVVGSGLYQVFKIQAHPVLENLTTIYDPLAVPTYPQMTPSWCSPTAMTDVANYHQGGWPAGGFGSVWGESSNWYLAGQAGQPYGKGFFFHWLLGAVGYTVPSDTKLSFSNGNAEVIIWNWYGAVPWGSNLDFGGLGPNVDYDYADYLFNAYQAYVESFVWGVNGPRRPVAWGSSLAGHSRAITGSDGTVFYYNDPGSGSLNSAKPWADYRQEVMDSLTAEKIEVIDTLVLFAEPRPAEQRRGVLWLLPRADNGFAGSVALIAGDTGQPATEWNWGGDQGHSNGYYYTDKRGVLPSDPLFNVQLKALDFLDKVEYGFAVVNITGMNRDYRVDVVLQNESFTVLKNVGKFDVSVGQSSKVNMFPAGDFYLYGLPPGLYTLKFVLLQNDLYQDVKYVQFRLAESDLPTLKPFVVLNTPAYCRVGPSTDFEVVTTFMEGEQLDLLGVNPEKTWGKVEKMVKNTLVQCWISLKFLDVFSSEEPVILTVPTLAPQAGPRCTSTLDRTACREAGGTYQEDPPLCRCPRS